MRAALLPAAALALALGAAAPGQAAPPVAGQGAGAQGAGVRGGAETVAAAPAGAAAGAPAGAFAGAPASADDGAVAGAVDGAPGSATADPARPVGNADAMALDSDDPALVEGDEALPPGTADGAGPDGAGLEDPVLDGTGPDGDTAADALAADAGRGLAEGVAEGLAEGVAAGQAAGLAEGPAADAAGLAGGIASDPGRGDAPDLASAQAAGASGGPQLDGPTLARLRADLRAVSADVQALRAELRAGGAPAYRAAGGDKAIDRLNALEAELARLTGQTERLGRRIDAAIRDGSNRVGDIEFRLCEAEPGCDLGALTTAQLGTQSVPASGGAPVPVPVPVSGRGMAAGAAAPASAAPLTAEERRDLAAAEAALAAGDNARAATLFGAYAERHAGGAGVDEAICRRAAALDAAGDAKAAVAAWLDCFSAAPGGPRAADALMGLARLAQGGAGGDACLYLAEVGSRFPATPEAAEAARRAAAARCPQASDPTADPTAAAAPAPVSGPAAAPAPAKPGHGG